jgi:hypothetical protein
LARHYVNQKVQYKDTHGLDPSGYKEEARPGITWKLTRDWELLKAEKWWKEAKRLDLEPHGIHS